MNSLPVQLEIALQDRQLVPWEFDLETGQFSWYQDGEPSPQRKSRSLQSWLEEVQPEDRAIITSALQHPVEGRDVVVEFRMNSQSGTLHRIQARGRLVSGPTGRRVYGVSIDLTVKQRVERRLAAQQAVTAALEEWTTLDEVSRQILKIVCEVQQWEIGNMWSLDEDAGSMALFCSWCQPGAEAAAKAVSQKQSFEKGRGLPGAVWAAGKAVWVADVTLNDGPQRITVASQHGIRGASAYPVFLGDELFGVMEFFSSRVRRENPEVMALLRAIGSQLGQVIERRKTEADLRLSEERHRTMSETASDAILSIDEDSNIIFANPAVEQIFGFRVEELLGKKLTTLIPPSLRHAHLNGLARYLATGAKALPWRNVEMPGLHKSGRELHLELSFGEFRKDGKHFFTGVARDISARKQAEEALKTSEKLAATGRLAASMAHEINNPLTSVTNILYLLEADAGMSSANHRLVETAQQELQRVAHIVKQTLGFYRESTHPVPTDLVEIVDGVLEMFANQLRSRTIQVTRHYDVNSNVQSLPGELRQVIANLVENALQALPEGGRLTVHLKDAVELRPPYRTGVRLVVGDNGSGINPQDRRKIFEPFFTTKGEKGTGLGLWVSRGIVEKHGGSIRLRSSIQPGCSGTCFSVFFPSISRLVSASAAA